MTIYFVNKRSKQKSPFEITDAHNKHILTIGDVCIRDTEKGLLFLIIVSNTNSWGSCKCLGCVNPQDIAITGNSLLFSFDGIHKRLGSVSSLSLLANTFQTEPLHSFFNNAIDIVSYKSDCWDLSLFVKMNEISPCVLDNTQVKYASKPIENSGKTLFADYFPEPMKKDFLSLTGNGLDLKSAYQQLRSKYPSDFRKSLLSFLTDNPTSNIYNK